MADWSRRPLADIKPEIVQRYKLERRKEYDKTVCIGLGVGYLERGISISKHTIPTYSITTLRCWCIKNVPTLQPGTCWCSRTTNPCRLGTVASLSQLLRRRGTQTLKNTPKCPGGCIPRRSVRRPVREISWRPTWPTLAG